MTNPKSKIDQQLEARLVALALGEASDFEGEELERLIAEHPEVRAAYEEIREVHSLLQFVGEDEWPPAAGDAGESDDVNESWKLPKSKREAVVSVIEGKGPAIQMRVGLKRAANGRRSWARIAGIAAAVSGVAVVLFVCLLPTIQAPREAALRATTADASARYAADAMPGPGPENEAYMTDSDDDGNAGRGFIELFDGAVPGSQITNGTVTTKHKSPSKKWDFVAPQLKPAHESVFQSGVAGSSDDLMPSEGKVNEYRKSDALLQDGNGDGQAWSLSGGTNMPFGADGESGQGEFGNSSQSAAYDFGEPANQEGQQGEQSNGAQHAAGWEANRGGQSRHGNNRSSGAFGGGGGGFGSGSGSGDYGGRGGYNDQGVENAKSDGQSYAGKNLSGGAVDRFDTAQDDPADLADLAQQFPSTNGDVAVMRPGASQRSELTRLRDLVSSGKDVGKSVESFSAIQAEGQTRLEDPAAGPALPVVDGFNGPVQVDNMWTDGLTMPNGSFVSREEKSELNNEVWLNESSAVPSTGVDGVKNESERSNEPNTANVPTSRKPARKNGRLDLYIGSLPSYTGSLPSSPTIGFEVQPAERDQGDQPYGFYYRSKWRRTGSEVDYKKSKVTRGLEEKLAAKEPFSTFSLHVSDVSFKLARAALAKGQWPETSKIRVEEFVNAFDYGDPLPSRGERVACSVEQAIHPFLQQRNLLRVSMRTAATGRSSTTPLRLTFLLDNSGSMERIDRQETVRKAFAMLAQQLKPIDQVTLISFARETRLLADKVSGTEAQQLIQRIQNLPSEGGTNIEAALQLAHDKAREQFVAGAQNRIILLTDGAVNLGNADPGSLSQKIVAMREQGIAFDAAGISADGLNDEMLEALTRKGDGRYYLLDSVDSADDGFAKQIAGALRPSAKNVKVQIEFNPHRVGSYKLLGFEKHRLKKEDFRNDKVDAAEMAAAEAGVAVYQFEARPDGVGDVGSVSVRFLDVESGRMVENRWPIPYQADAQRMDVATPSLRIATSAAMLASKLRGDPLGQAVEMKSLTKLISSLPPECRNGRVQELEQMIQQTRQLQP